MDNAEIANTLEQVAELLHETGADVVRVGAYRRAAATIRRLDRSASRILAEEGKEGLKRLERIGSKLADNIEELVTTGSLGLLDALRAEVAPEAVLDSVPAIGDTLARRIIKQLGITTLSELQVAAGDGRLEEVQGIGPAKASRIRKALADRLGPLPRPAREEPPVSELLAVDSEYREKTAAGQLHRIAPKRFNPKREAWLPILHTRRDARRYTALFSNTKLAHQLEKTQDWVVLYYQRPDREGQATVVTETGGDLAGRRVVRGREAESREHYERERVPGP